jgi:amino acid adenylation domain-containing protein
MLKNNVFDYHSYNNVLQLIDEQVLLTPNEPAVFYQHKTLSYTDLNLAANALAHLLLEEDVEANMLLGICLDRSLALAVGILGILKSGAAYVPFDPEYPADRLNYMLNAAQCSIVITQKKYADIFINSGAVVFIWEDISEGLKSMPNKNPEIDIDRNHLLYVLFTSGSTGIPKGVAMRHEPLVNLALWQKNETTLTEAANTLQFAPISFDVSFQEFVCTWSTGGCLYMVDDAMRLQANKLLQFINDNQIERIYLPFIALQHFCEIAVEQQLIPLTLKDVITAGEQLQITPQIRSFFNLLPDCLLHNHYGPTETHVATALTLEGTPNTWPNLPSIGKAIANISIYILDENLYPVKIDAEGEIYIAGVGLAAGYLKNEALTNDRFLPDALTMEAGKRMYKTGDIGKWMPDGNIQYLGRADGQVKIRGYRIELGEIETTLASFEGISQTAVIAQEDKNGFKRLVAYLVCKNFSQNKLLQIRQWLATKLPEYMQPSAYVNLDTLPRTPSGKIDRKSLPAPDTARPLPDEMAPPSTEAEIIMAGIWSNLLMIDEVGINDNFFELGGNSLLAIQFIAQYQQQSGIEIPVVKLYQNPTITGINYLLNESLPELKSQPKKPQLASNDIAIIGLSCRLPGANDINQFWNNLVTEKESITFFDKESVSEYVGAAANDTNYVAARGIIDAASFDAAFFGMNPKLAAITDPQQRIFLEMAFHAIEDAGYAKNYKDKLIGVYAGVGNNTYYLNNILKNEDALDSLGSFQAMLANEKDYVATLAAYLLDLKGPALSIHTACSTSLVAIITAVKALRNCDCDMALAGGITVTAPVNSGHIYSEGAMYSKDGHTRPYDAQGTGTVFSDGGGMILLKRYADALNDGDNIHAVIVGVGINNDGHDKASFSAPSVGGQARAVSMALDDANVNAAEISFVEGHGTATPIGDPIEVEALTIAYKKHTDAKEFCFLSSVKSNIGHLTAGAGAAGLLKAVLAVKHQILPATLHYENANPNLNLTATPFKINNKKTNLQSDQPILAGISSFGVGGTNAHVIIKQHIKQKAEQTLVKQPLILLSAKTPSALAANAKAMAVQLTSNDTIHLTDLAQGLYYTKATFNVRQSLVASNKSDAIEMLQQIAEKQHFFKAQQQNKIVFTFPGQGAQYLRMGADLHANSEVFRTHFDRCCEIYHTFSGTSLADIIFNAEDEETPALNETQYTQPALFIIGYSLAQTWKHYGVEPDAVLGHSIGEFVAACLANVFSLDDALLLVSERGRLMQNCPRGSMISVGLAAETVMPMLNENLSIAAINSSQLCVVSGVTSAIENLQHTLDEKGIVNKLLRTSHAFHSPMMDEVVKPFEAIVSQISLQAPQLQLISSVTAQPITATEATSAVYWANHLRNTVVFADAIATAWQTIPNAIFIECGPRNTATTLAKQQANADQKQKTIASLGSADSKTEWQQLMHGFGLLWCLGYPINLSTLYPNKNYIWLPPYQFDKTQYWINPKQNNTQDLLPKAPLQNIMTAVQTKPNTQNLIDELKGLFEEASGMDMGNDDTALFTEIGLDSLFLTQIAGKLTKRFGQKISFRQLNETLPNFESLANYLLPLIPKAKSTEVAPLPQLQVNSTLLPTGSSVLEQMLLQQMQMQQQLLQYLTQQQNAGGNIDINKSTATKPTTTELTVEENAEIKKPYGAIARIEKKVAQALTQKQIEWLDDFTINYTLKTKSSKQYTQLHRAHLADPRVVTGFKPNLKELVYQIVVDRSKDAYVWDLDNNKYVDILNGFGSNMFGHSPDFIKQAISKQLDEGYELGPQHPLAGEVAKLICEFTTFDRVAICNTGSEAVLGCMRMARTVTGKNLIVTFNGAYHGINDEIIVRGSRSLKSYPASAGIPDESVQNVLVWIMVQMKAWQ